ncbi:TetR/AcrR family transcriptional regulator [Aliiruegeria sabulilitoris]|uniref:TetR/AcrR family transcriptional regulator n=1 Tax=Aliiruegeria sabulilitoris TaxID=1510458 RepID=UPI00082B439C|nr:TetR/AcrR family transcriptional regulator [Aliiruegeria sabulilitoris]NDR59628.1 TetR/AcrR family transcriptional regulator [Pseudoruegeria sp. M32A2M]
MKKDSYHHKNLKNALIEEATRQLDADPDSDISLRGLARELGVSAMAPYAHFQNKAELLDAVALRGHEIFGIAMQRVAESDLGLEDRLFAFSLAYLDFSRDHPGQFHLMFNHGLRAEEDPVRQAGGANLAILHNSIAAELPGADEATLIVMTDLLYTVTHGITTLSANDVLGSVHREDFDTRDLVRLAIQALALKFQQMQGS